MKPIITCLVAAGLGLFFSLTASADPTNTAPASPDKKNSVQLIEPVAAGKLVAEKKVVVIDVRTPEEFAAGHIAGATNLNSQDAEFRAKLEKLDKNQPYLVNCAAGGRSARACKAMGQMEFKSVYDLKGGILAWEKAGQPLEK